MVRRNSARSLQAAKLSSSHEREASALQTYFEEFKQERTLDLKGKPAQVIQFNPLDVNHQLAFIQGSHLQTVTLGEKTGEIKQLAEFKTNLQGMSWRGDGKVLAAAAKGDVRLFDPKEGLTLRRLSAEACEIKGLGFSHELPHLAVGSQSGSLEIFDFEDGRSLGKWDTLFGDAVSGVAAYDSHLYVAASYDGTCKIVDSRTFSTTLKPNAMFSQASPIECLAISDLRIYAATGSTISMFDLRYYVNDASVSPLTVKTFGQEHGKAITSMELSPDGRLLATSCLDSVVRIYSAGGLNGNNLKVQHAWTLDSPQACVTWGAYQATLAMSSSDGRVDVYRRDDWNQSQEAPQPKLNPKWSLTHTKQKAEAAQALDDETKVTMENFEKESLVDLFFRKFEYSKVLDLACQYSTGRKRKMREANGDFQIIQDKPNPQMALSVLKELLRYGGMEAAALRIPAQGLRKAFQLIQHLYSNMPAPERDLLLESFLRIHSSTLARQSGKLDPETAQVLREMEAWTSKFLENVKLESDLLAQTTSLITFHSTNFAI